MNLLILLGILINIFNSQLAYADNDSSFPFDKPCLTYNKTIFKTGGALLDVMITADFPQYCTLYSLSKYQVKQKRDEGYFIIASNAATIVFIKTKKVYDISQPVGQWAYFVGQERFMMNDGQEKEFYTFQERDQ